MTVPVAIEVWPGEPPLDAAEWDIINECAIHVGSGRIVVAGCTDYFPDAARIQVEMGTYGARVLYKGLDSLTDDGLDGNDSYLVQIWPAKRRNVRTVKLWQPR